MGHQNLQSGGIEDESSFIGTDGQEEKLRLIMVL